jgi:hypothetical protein
MDARGWRTPDIKMETSQLELPTVPWTKLFLPLLLRSQW